MKLDGMKLRRERERQGKSQEDVVRIVQNNKQKITVGTVSNAERGHEMYPATAAKICVALGIEIEDYRMPMEGNGNGHAAGKNNSRSRSTKRNLSKPARVA